MKFSDSDKSETLGGAGILSGTVGGALMLVGDDTGIRLAFGVAGMALFVVGLLLAIVQSVRVARASGAGFFRSFFRCIRRALSFLFWMLP
jgi:hypothetical protein